MKLSISHYQDSSTGIGARASRRCARNMQAGWMSSGPDLGDLAGDGDQVPLLVPYFAVRFKQPAGHEAGPEGAVEPPVLGQVPNAHRQLDGGNPGDHPV